jgi:hypothetical protein
VLTKKKTTLQSILGMAVGERHKLAADSQAKLTARVRARFSPTPAEQAEQPATKEEEEEAKK